MVSENEMSSTCHPPKLEECVYQYLCTEYYAVQSIPVFSYIITEIYAGL